jgi:protein gp37
MAKRHAANPHFTEDEQAAYAGHNIVMREKELEAPLRLRKSARIGVQFMGDLFLEGVGRFYRERVWDVMERCPQHTFVVLTKRPDRMLVSLDELVVSHGILPNVWLGTSIENMEYGYRAEYLRRCPAAVRFLSLEPLLGSLSGMPGIYDDMDWVTCGGETGSGARPMQLHWARESRGRCKYRIPFFFKQVGMWAEEFIPTAREWAMYSPIMEGWNYIRDRASAEKNAQYGFTVWSRLGKQAPTPDDLMVREYPGETDA